MTAPKVFISYAWTTPEHQKWVRQLAEDLEKEGAEVVLDVWDLSPGQDTIAFMERVKGDRSITHVAMICDRNYVEKANGRRGGVGTETQIISGEVFRQLNEQKYVALVRERNESGELCLPTYYGSRLHIDVTRDDTYIDDLRKVQRWLFNKPEHVRPPRGNPPAFLTEVAAPVSRTESLQRRCVDAIRQGRPQAAAMLSEYFDEFAVSLESYRIPEPVSGSLDDYVIKKIEEMRGPRDEILQVISALCRYDQDQAFGDALQRLFEKLYPYLDRPERTHGYVDGQFDNFRFFVHELFLYTIAISIKVENFGLGARLLNAVYYIGNAPHVGSDHTASFLSFWQQTPSLEQRKRRLNLNRTSLRADLLMERTTGTGVEGKSLMQADFVCTIRWQLQMGANWSQVWWPDTLVYAEFRGTPFEIFARATSRTYLNRILPVLGAEGAGALEVLVQNYRLQRIEFPRVGAFPLNPGGMMNVANLGTRP